MSEIKPGSVTSTGPGGSVPMTDHGGAASPRTEAGKCPDCAHTAIHACGACPDCPQWHEAAQEAPAPEGRCVHCGEARDAGVHDTAETCDAVRGPCLDPGRHHPYRAEARPPEGLDAALVEQALVEWSSATGMPLNDEGEVVFRAIGRSIAAIYDRLLAARLSAGGATKPPHREENPMLAMCPLCASTEVVRLVADWQERVEAGERAPIIGCGNPWHYCERGFDADREAVSGSAGGATKPRPSAPRPQ